MAITVKQSSTAAGGTSTSISTAFGVACSGGNGIVVTLALTTGTPASVTDNIGNTYVLAKLQNQFGIISAVYRCDNPAAGVTSVAVNYAASTQVVSIQAHEIYGQLTFNTSNGRGANEINQNAGAITTTVADTIVFITTRTSNSPTLPSGFTALAFAANYRFSYRVYTSTQTSLNPGWTVSVSNQHGSTITAFTSTNTTGPTVEVSLDDTLTWSGDELPTEADADLSDTLTWSDSFDLIEVDAELTDTLTWADSLDVDVSVQETLEDTLTWADALETSTPGENMLLVDLVIWSDDTEQDLGLADPLNWLDRFFYDDEVFPDLLAELADTLTWDMRSIEALILFDALSWADSFDLPIQTVMLEDTLTWGALTEADPNLLGASRYRR